MYIPPITDTMPSFFLAKHLWYWGDGGVGNLVWMLKEAIVQQRCIRFFYNLLLGRPFDTPKKRCFTSKNVSGQMSNNKPLCHAFQSFLDGVGSFNVGVDDEKTALQSSYPGIGGLSVLARFGNFMLTLSSSSCQWFGYITKALVYIFVCSTCSDVESRKILSSHKSFCCWTKRFAILPSLKLPVCPWKWMVGSSEDYLPFGVRPFFRCYVSFREGDIFYIDCQIQLDYTSASGTAETAVVTIYDTLILIFCHMYIYITILVM